jgi:Ca2+-binding RTX toxin-like protein
MGTSIRLVRVGRGYDIVTNFGTYKIADRTALKGVVVRARAGNDVVNLSPLDPDKTADVFGRAGNDNIRGGAAADILRGGLGNDTLTGGTGDDLLIGGDGSDRLVGSAGSDLLLAGIVDDLCRELDLRGLLDVWRAAKTRNDKAAAAELWRDYVSDDGIFDLLTGAVGADAFFASPLDRIVDRKAEDIVVPV